MAKNPLINLADFLVEDILAMSDEEIMAKCSAEDIAEAHRIRDRALAEIERHEKKD